MLSFARLSQSLACIKTRLMVERWGECEVTLKHFLFFLPCFFLLLCRVSPAQAVLSSQLTYRSIKESSHLILMYLFPLSCAITFQSPICLSLTHSISLSLPLTSWSADCINICWWCHSAWMESYTLFIAYERFAYFNPDWLQSFKIAALFVITICDCKACMLA